MGGGDSLYDKIDKGVRNCKVVISCVTKKYAISANCRREVSLTDALRRPMIPLLLEKMDWPPEGPMSMPFTQLLFINFYRDEEVQMKWTGPKFDELLTKLKDHLPHIDPFKLNIASDQGAVKPFNAKKEWRKVKKCHNGNCRHEVPILCCIVKMLPKLYRVWSNPSQFILYNGANPCILFTGSFIFPKISTFIEFFIEVFI